jgi:hypothetical protein
MIVVLAGSLWSSEEDDVEEDSDEEDTEIDDNAIYGDIERNRSTYDHADDDAMHGNESEGERGSFSSEETLEEIEQRLEKKRDWLRK